MLPPCSNHMMQRWQNKATYDVALQSNYTREMEYIERASFIEIYGLNIAYPISLVSLCFDFFKAHNILTLFRCQWFWCLFWFG